MNCACDTARLMLIEDSDIDVRFMRTALDRCGLSPDLQVCNRVGEALTHLESDTPLPDLIVLDLNLPDGDGRDVLRRLPEVPGYDEVPAVVLTTSISPDDRRECLDLGAEEYRVKPDTFAGLVALVDGFQRYLAC